MRPYYVYASFAGVFVALCFAAAFGVNEAKVGIPMALAAFLGWIAPSPKEMDK